MSKLPWLWLGPLGNVDGLCCGLLLLDKVRPDIGAISHSHQAIAQADRLGPRLSAFIKRLDASPHISQISYCGTLRKAGPDRTAISRLASIIGSSLRQLSSGPPQSPTLELTAR